MRYSIENNGQGIVMIKVFAPESLAPAFLSFIDQKTRENAPIIKPSQPLQNEKYFIDLTAKAKSIFDDLVKGGTPVKIAVSKTNYTLKAIGFANVSYGITKNILQKSGCFKQNSK